MLSVVVPTLNRIEQLGRAVASAQRVLQGESYEILVADGGSADGTVEWLRGAHGVHFIEGPDTSLYNGLNRALAVARGEYALWLNDDDVLLPGVAGLWRAARTSGADIVTGEAEIVDANGKAWRIAHGQPMTAPSVLFGIPTINSRIFRVGLLRTAGPFNEQIGMAADREMLFSLFARAARREPYPEPVYRYSAHAGSLSMSGSWAGARDVHVANLQLARHLAATHARETRLVRAFGAWSELGRARAQWRCGEPGAAVLALAGAFAWSANPAILAEAVRLHRQFRGEGSGW